MREQIEVEDAVNKTVERVSTGYAYIILTFTDGTYIRIEPGSDREGVPELWQPKFNKWHNDHHVRHILYKAGVMSEEERDEWELKEKEAEKEHNLSCAMNYYRSLTEEQREEFKKVL